MVDHVDAEVTSIEPELRADLRRRGDLSLGRHDAFHANDRKEPSVLRQAGSAPHLALTASRSTAPSAVRGSASVKTTRLGRLKRAIFDTTKSPICWAV